MNSKIEDIKKCCEMLDKDFLDCIMETVEKWHAFMIMVSFKEQVIRNNDNEE